MMTVDLRIEQYINLIKSSLIFNSPYDDEYDGNYHE